MNLEKGCVVWLTGLPGSGKTSIAKIVAKELKKRNKRVEVLDGDEVRRWLSPTEGFTREDRERHLRRVAYVAKLLSRNGVIVLCSFVSPYRKIRSEIRKIIEAENIPFIEVYVKCSLEECIKRDPKGLYKRALRGEIKQMTGIDDPYEEPEKAEVILDAEKKSIEENKEILLQNILKTLG
ncbi:MAG TPA: adenylyl-sulfate kinase [Thermoprotei archaeon]|nr:adenylyl-sulfate kinase [Thermoprotei archaeon]